MRSDFLKLGSALLLASGSSWPLMAQQHEVIHANTDKQAADLLTAIEIRAKLENLTGTAVSGSEGVVSGQRLTAVPLLRPGEVLEMVPGMIVTQHAGDGKANQYFLRGFNLDHGTDFATFLDGMPLNMPSHAHGQGYTDLNFIIPELIDNISYRKGPYFAEEGDFSSAGAARIKTIQKLERNWMQLTVGPHGYQRELIAGRTNFGSGLFMFGLEHLHNNGPWEVPQDNRKINVLTKYSQGSSAQGFSVAGMFYQNKWVSTDQIPLRALEQGIIGRYGSLDPSSGGATHRYSLSGEITRRASDSKTKANAWALDSGLDLWSNFEYCMNDLAQSGQCQQGDQFKQAEKRKAFGAALSHTRINTWFDREHHVSMGVQLRQDQIRPAGLYKSKKRDVTGVIRQDDVKQSSLGIWTQSELHWSSTLRSVVGMRADNFQFDVQSNVSANSGKTHDSMVSPKMALIWQPMQKTEVYANYGHGFHSNDARGTTIRIDPSEISQVAIPVQALVKTKGHELGIRTELLPGWQSTVSLWQLRSASELVFVGDAGTTEASRPSTRYGIEWTNFYKLSERWALDADLAFAHARFKDVAPEGSYIPGAATTTGNMGITFEPTGAWSGALRVRYFGPRPLKEDNSIRSEKSWVSNLKVGYRWSARTQITMDVYNLMNKRNNDIEYYYASQMSHEAIPVDGKHIHPAEKRSARLSLKHTF